MTIKIKVKGKIKFPSLDLTNELREIAERIVIPEIANGIQKERDISGRTYAKLADSTIRKKGHARPLIETGKLHRSFKYQQVGKNRVKVYIRADRIDVAEALQVKGVRTKSGKRYFEFFGVTAAAEQRAVALVDKKIRRLTHRGR